MPLNGLKLNNSKTEFMLLQSKFAARVPAPNIQIGCDSVVPTKSARNLGVIFDDTLSLAPHISATCRAAFFQLRKIRRIRRFLTLDATKTLVHSLISSRLDYCNSALAGLPDSELCKLQCVLHAAARLTSRCGKHDHITPILKELHWLPIQQRILFKVLVLVYKALHDLAPPYIKSLLVPYNPPRTLRSSSQGLLYEPPFDTKSYGGRAFSCYAPRAYNKLPLEICLAQTLSIFKAKLKTYLFGFALS